MDYTLSERIERAALTQVYERRPGDPLCRPLQIYALNPAVSYLAGGVAQLPAFYEPLQPGPMGSVIDVSGVDDTGVDWGPTDLEDRLALIGGGYRASMADPRFHHQMVYAIAMLTYDNFRAALGRDIAWAFAPRAYADGRNRLRLRPHGACEGNAWYDPEAGEIVFGYFSPVSSTPVVPAKGGNVFCCLSHDVITHEMTHALLDGVRAHFVDPTNADVLAFHEAFADLVVFFQHFRFGDLVRCELERARGRLNKADLLTGIAGEFGRGIGDGMHPLRTLVEIESEVEHAERPLLRYDDVGQEPHDRGRVLARAVFAAFHEVYERRARPYLKLASNGTGTLPPGDLPTGLVDILVNELCKLAEQFLTMCVRAIDYVPPVDLLFGDYLRALITSDCEVVPNDDHGYRESLIRAFGARGIYGEGTASMTDDGLSWGAPSFDAVPVEALSFAQMRFDGDPGRPVNPTEMRRLAHALGEYVTQPRIARECGLVSPRAPEFACGEFGLPVIESIRSARRMGPDRRIVFDTVAEVLQIRRVDDGRGGTHPFWGGSTLIIGPRGELRYAIRKRVDNDQRRDQEVAYCRDTPQPQGAEDAKRRGGQRAVMRYLCGAR